MESQASFRRVGFAIAVAVAALSSSCLTSKTWLQFHGDGPNQGFMSVKTSLLLKPRWVADVGGAVAYSSQVLDAAGNIYLSAGWNLVKVTPDGTVAWTRNLPNESLFATPAVGPSGRIYVIANSLPDGQNYQSRLYCFDGGGSVLWSHAFGGVGRPEPTLSSPKVWGDGNHAVVFVYCSGRLYAFAEDGRMPAALDAAHHCTVITNSSWFADFFATIWNAIKQIGMKKLDVSGLRWYDDISWQPPTPAVLSFGRTPFEVKPLVVVADSCGMAGIQWDPVAETLTQLWSVNSPEASPMVTPAVSAGGTLATARKDGTKGVLQFYDVLHDIHKPSLLAEYRIDDEFSGTPAAIWMGFHFYVASRHRIHRFNALGQLTASADLAGKTWASPSCSVDHVYVNTTVGLEAFDLDLQSHGQNSMAPEGGGINAPTIAPSKAIYAMTPGWHLRAF